VWRQAWSASGAESPEELIAAKEMIEKMLTKEQFEIFMLHVVEGHSLAKVGLLMRRRKADVCRLWEEGRARLREAA
jgi:hypothetical protein